MVFQVELTARSILVHWHIRMWSTINILERDWQLDSPITTTSPASSYWGINEQITYGTSGTTVLAETAGIVDTGADSLVVILRISIKSVHIPGTTLVLIASDAYSKYQSMTGASLDSTTGLLTLTATNFNNLQSLFFTISGVCVTNTFSHQYLERESITDNIRVHRQCSTVAPFTQHVHWGDFWKYLPNYWKHRDFLWVWIGLY